MPQSMRLYGGFLMDLVNDRARGKALIVRAELLEEQHARSVHRVGSDDGRHGDGSVCICVMSARHDSLGEIQSVNTSLLRQFGFARTDLIGRNVTLLMPPPFPPLHHGFIEGYFESGRPLLSIQRPLFGMVC